MSAFRRRHLIDHQLAWSPLNQPPAIVDRLRGVLGTNGRSKVCIYGCGYGSREAPLDDPDWQVWGLNTVPPLDRQRRIRADLWWDLHQRSAQSAQDLQWLAALPVPVFVPDDLLDLGSHAVRFPIERIEASVAPGPFACTFAYMLAYALMVGYHEIGMFGVELAYGDRRERTVEWASVSWWMGFAEALGVTFYLPAGSRLGRHPHRYGLAYQAEIDSTKAYVRQWTDWDADEEARKQTRTSVGG